MKICVSLTGRNRQELLKEALAVKEAGCDLAEWRVDCFDEPLTKQHLTEILKQLKAELSEIPLIFTFRTAVEGGSFISREDYVELNQTAAGTGLVSIIDLELFDIVDKNQIDEQSITSIISTIHEAGSKVLLSNHDFKKTPPKDIIINRLCMMQNLGADIVKIAVMPQCEADVEILLAATRDMKRNHNHTQIITISMGEMGRTSRLNAGSLGTDITFGTLGRASAPGQVAVELLR